jgi:hypothetical protein
VSFKQADSWIGGFRRFWDEGFSRLDDYLLEMKADEAAKAVKRKPKVRAKEKSRGQKSR